MTDFNFNPLLADTEPSPEDKEANKRLIATLGAFSCLADAVSLDAEVQGYDQEAARLELVILENPLYPGPRVDKLLVNIKMYAKMAQSARLRKRGNRMLPSDLGE